MRSTCRSRPNHPRSAPLVFRRVASGSMTGAVFFDLDRTLLRGASGPVLAEALRKAGVINRSIPGEGLLYRFFDVVGETRPSMLLTRQAARFARGWPRDQVQAAGEKAADDLAGAVQPFAR